MFDWLKKKSPKITPEPQMHSLQDILYDLLDGHGLKADKHENWLLIGNELPGLRGGYFVARYKGWARHLHARI